MFPHSIPSQNCMQRKCTRITPISIWRLWSQRFPIDFLYDFVFFPSIDPLWFPSTWGSSGKLPLCTCFYMGPKIMRISPISISVEQLRKLWCCTSASERSSTTTTTWRAPRCVSSRRRRVREGSRRRLRCELDDPADFYCNGALLWFVYWVYCWGKKNVISMMINDCLWVFLDVFWLMHLRWWKEKGWSLDTPRNKPTRGLISSRVDAARKWAADQSSRSLFRIAVAPVWVYRICRIGWVAKPVIALNLVTRHQKAALRGGSGWHPGDATDDLVPILKDKTQRLCHGLFCLHW